jgi:hypothetical protein
MTLYQFQDIRLSWDSLSWDCPLSWDSLTNGDDALQSPASNTKTVESDLKAFHEAVKGSLAAIASYLKNEGTPTTTERYVDLL